MSEREWRPGDIERAANMNGSLPKFRAWHQRDWEEPRNRHHENCRESEKGYRACFDGALQSDGPAQPAWARSWEYSQLENDDWLIVSFSRRASRRPPASTMLA